MTRTANEFLTPQAIKVEAASGTSAKVILEPLERGFGALTADRQAATMTKTAVAA